MYGNYLFLRPGSYIKWGSIDLGETQDGIRISFNYSTKPLYNQKICVPVDFQLENIVIKVSTRVMSLFFNNIKDLCYTNDNGYFPIVNSLPTYQLQIYGKLLGSSFKYLDIVFFRTVVESIGEISLRKNEESPLEVTWHCLYDNSMQSVGKFTYST